MTKKKNNFLIIEDEEIFNEHSQLQLQEDSNVIDFLQTLVEKENHKEFNFVILNLGVLLQTISVFFNLKEKEINNILELRSSSVQQRKITVIINEINEKINLKYDFDENTEIITKIFVYQENSYLMINKVSFLKLLLGTKFMDENNMENI